MLPCHVTGFMLLDAGTDDLPEGVVAARLAGRNIQSVEASDLAYFSNLKVLDLADNKVSGKSHVLELCPVLSRYSSKVSAGTCVLELCAVLSRYSSKVSAGSCVLQLCAVLSRCSNKVSGKAVCWSCVHSWPDEAGC
jgi:hypothetical protein